MVGDAPRQVFGAAGDAQQPAGSGVLDPHGAAHAAPVRDGVERAAQRKFVACANGAGLGRRPRARRDPGTVLLDEFASLRGSCRAAAW